MYSCVWKLVWNRPDVLHFAERENAAVRSVDPVLGTIRTSIRRRLPHACSKIDSAALSVDEAMLSQNQGGMFPSRGIYRYSGGLFTKTTSAAATNRANTTVSTVL